MISRYSLAWLGLAVAMIAPGGRARAQLPHGAVPGAQDVTLTSGRDRAGFRLDSGHLVEGSVGPDLVVGAPVGAGEVRVYEGSTVTAAGTVPQGDAAVVIHGLAGTEAGWSIAVGDYDGDGDDDLALGAPSEVGAAGRPGVVYVFEGPIAPGEYGVGDAPVQLVAPPDASRYFGWTLAAGDLDGDGRDELIAGDCAGAPSNVHVMFGLDSGRYEVGSRGDRYTTFVGQTLFGCALATGDLDGDGYEDLVVGAPGEPVYAGRSFAGAAYLIYGRSAFDPGYALVPPERSALAGFEARLVGDAIGVLFSGASLDGASFGWSLSIGDLRRSSEPELLIGMPYARCDGCGVPTPGSVYVVDGARRLGIADVHGLRGVTQHLGLTPGDQYGHDVAVIGHDRPSTSNVFAVGAPGTQQAFLERFALGVTEPHCTAVVGEDGTRYLHCDSAPADGRFVVIGAGRAGVLTHAAPSSAFGWTVHGFAHGRYADLFVAAPAQYGFEQAPGDPRIYGFFR